MLVYRWTRVSFAGPDPLSRQTNTHITHRHDKCLAHNSQLRPNRLKHVMTRSGPFDHDRVMILEGRTMPRDLQPWLGAEAASCWIPSKHPLSAMLGWAVCMILSALWSVNIRRLCTSSQSAVGFFTVGKKHVSHRLVCASRATNQLHIGPPRAQLTKLDGQQFQRFGPPTGAAAAERGLQALCDPASGSYRACPLDRVSLFCFSALSWALYPCQSAMGKVALRGVDMAGSMIIRDGHRSLVLETRGVLRAMHVDNGTFITQRRGRTTEVGRHVCAAPGDPGLAYHQTADASTQFESVVLAFECPSGVVARHTPWGAWRLCQAIRGLRWRAESTLQTTHRIIGHFVSSKCFRSSFSVLQTSSSTVLLLQWPLLVTPACWVWHWASLYSFSSEVGAAATFREKWRFREADAKGAPVPVVQDTRLDGAMSSCDSMILSHNICQNFVGKACPRTRTAGGHWSRASAP